MFDRPLVPILVSYIGGLLLGHILIPPEPSPVFFVVLLFTTGLVILSLFIPFRFRVPCFLAIFFLAGVLHTQNQNHPSDLLPLANERKRVIIEGTVLEPARIYNDAARFVVRAERLIAPGGEKKVKEKIQVTIYNQIRVFSPGERIRFPAGLRTFRNFNNPGKYDYELAMRLRGLSCAASVPDGRRIVPMGKGDLGFPMDLLEKGRRHIRRLFQEKLSAPNSGLYRALILGERQGIGPETRESFEITGLSHILAVSGLHIGLVAWLAFYLSKGLLSFSYSLTLRMDIRKTAAVITIFPVVAYTCLAGVHVPSQRAMIMVLAYLFSIIMGREKEVWSTFALAALIVLAVDPDALFSVSFQLSFCAVLGILWLAPAIYKKIPIPVEPVGILKILFHRFRVYVAVIVIVTLSAVIFLLPITGYYFHRISLVSILANLFVMPLLGFWVIPFGLISALCLPLFSPLSELFLRMGAWGLEWMVAVIQFWSHFQWAALWVITPSMIEILLFYTLIFFVFFRRRLSWARTGLMVVLLLFVVDISYWTYMTRFRRDLRVTYLDVGHGNAALIQFPGKERMLIDGGGFYRNNFDVGRIVVAPFLFHSKIRRIDTIVLSHPHPDHMNGLRFIASHFRPKEFWYNGDRVESESFMELLGILDSGETKILTPTQLQNGKDISGVKIEYLHPLPERRGESSRQPALGLNDNSLVLKITYGGKSFLFPGDLEKAGEAVVTKNSGSLLKSDVMLVPHHGGRSSCSKPFLDMVRPSIAIVSSGKGNRFGSPHPETRQRLEDIGCRIIQINRVGAVRISVRPGRFEVKSYLR
ncbi:DNA internalization-related competence protein ComEC/Rec2 [bacterium]|nr:DNA internalization-related competence protein ComEC/Rec2 [bacterium]